MTDRQKKIAPHSFQGERIQNPSFEGCVGKVDNWKIVESAEGLGEVFFREEANLDEMPPQTASETVALAQHLVHLRTGDVAFADERFF
jgi:hypothetical protein